MNKISASLMIAGSISLTNVNASETVNPTSKTTLKGCPPAEIIIEEMKKNYISRTKAEFNVPDESYYINEKSARWEGEAEINLPELEKDSNIPTRIARFLTPTYYTNHPIILWNDHQWSWHLELPSDALPPVLSDNVKVKLDTNEQVELITWTKGKGWQPGWRLFYTLYSDQGQYKLVLEPVKRW